MNSFLTTLAVRLRQQYGPAAFITSHNACAHIDQLDDVFRGVEHWLADDGVFGLEVGYFLDVYQNIWFDTIYHEHLDYHTVGPFRALLARVGMEAIGVQRVAPQGGSIRLFVQRADGPHEADQSVAALTELERQAGLCAPETFAAFGRRIDDVGASLRALLGTLKSQGKSIAGYGAPTKSTTLLNHFRIGPDQLDFLVDDNPLKYGLFSPVIAYPGVSSGRAVSPAAGLRVDPGLEFRDADHGGAPAVRRGGRAVHRPDADRPNRRMTQARPRRRTAPR